MRKIVIKIEKGIYVRNLNKSLKEKIKEELTFDNKKYQEAIKRGYSPSGDLEPYIFFFLESRTGRTLWVPRGYINRLLHLIKNSKTKYKIIDKTVTNKRIKWKFKGENRSYQTKAVNAVLKYPVGVLEAPTGAGKTVCGCKVISERGQRTLIIVHSKELLHQWKKAIKQFLDYDCGLIGDGNFKVKDITVGIINSVRNNVDELSKDFSQIICDECHRVSSNTWADTIQDFTACYILGLTATAFRADGLGKGIFLCIGPKMHKVSREKLNKIGAVLVPKLFKVQTNFKYNFADDYSTMLSTLTMNEERNKLITRKIASDINKYSESVLVVSDRKNHCETLQKMLLDKGISSYVLTGNTKKKERAEITKIAKTKRIVLISTIQLIGEGFDAPNLCSCFLTTPIKFKGRLIQIVGRVLRPKKGKIPRLYDFRDDYVSVFRFSGFSRDKEYKKMGVK